MCTKFFFLIIVLLFFFLENLCGSFKKESLRNPFCFPDNINTEKKDVHKNDVVKEEQLQLVTTESKWEVKTVLPSSVIVQHKEDGQIREIALTGTCACS